MTNDETMHNSSFTIRISSFSMVHVPVLLKQVVGWLDPQPGMVLVDGTVGGGGHARALAKGIGDKGLLIGIGPRSGGHRRRRADLRGLPVRLVRANFATCPKSSNNCRSRRRRRGAGPGPFQ